MAHPDPKLLCPPEAKAELETQNGVKQLDYITYLVNELQIREIRPSHLQELHKIAIEDIYPCGGRYRNAVMQVEIKGSDHRLPHESQVTSLVVELMDFLNMENNSQPVLERAAYALWRVNWIHPFAGGNGRTARALAYLIVCIDNGKPLPGVPSMPTIISRRRDEYVQCLKAADAAELQGKIDLSQMSSFLTDVLTEQLESAINFSKLGLRIGPSTV